MLLLKYIFLGYMDNAPITLAWLTAYVILLPIFEKNITKYKKIGVDEKKFYKSYWY